jgi:hypothetical protein
MPVGNCVGNGPRDGEPVVVLKVVVLKVVVFKVVALEVVVSTAVALTVELVDPDCLAGVSLVALVKRYRPVAMAPPAAVVTSKLVLHDAVLTVL